MDGFSLLEWEERVPVIDILITLVDGFLLLEWEERVPVIGILITLVDGFSLLEWEKEYLVKFLYVNFSRIYSRCDELNEADELIAVQVYRVEDDLDVDFTQ